MHELSDSAILIYVQIYNIRTEMISALQKAFPEYRLTCAEGGRTSFDVFPRTWDKTLALQKLQGEGFEEIHYFGDKTHKASIYISQCSCMSLTQRCLTGRQ